MGLAMTTKLNIAKGTSAGGRATNRAESAELLLHVDHRVIVECSDAQRKEKAMDKTLCRQLSTE